MRQIGKKEHGAAGNIERFGSVMHLGKEDVRYGEGTVIVIPQISPHTTGWDDVFDSLPVSFYMKCRTKRSLIWRACRGASHTASSNNQYESGRQRAGGKL